MSTTKIFVGNIYIGTQTEELRELFAQYGEVTECAILGAGNFAFVHMADSTEAETAIENLNGYDLNGLALNIELSTSKTQGRRKTQNPNMRGFSPAKRGGAPGNHGGIPKRSTTKVFVGNIKDGTKSEELRAIFEPYGEVAEADVISGYGFVHMKHLTEAIKAIKALANTFLNGNRLNIELSTEATQGRSHDVGSKPEMGMGMAGAGGFAMRGRPMGRGRGLMVGAGNRYDPYLRVPPPYRAPFPPADPYAASSGPFGYSYDPYASNDYAGASGVVAAPRAPIARPAGPASASSDTFARDLLNLYIKNPVAFDKYAKDPLVRQSLSLNQPNNTEDDPYYRPPKEYYETKSATSGLMGRSTGMQDDEDEGFAPIMKRPILPIGSGRMGVTGVPPPRPVGPLLGQGSMGHLARPRFAGPRPGNLYTSFE